MTAPNLPAPECKHGYPLSQAAAIAGPLWPAVERLMDGQTQTICPTHGAVEYTYDVERALRSARRRARSTNTADPDIPVSGVDALRPGMTGRWLVTSQRSAHIWDLDDGSYQRLPGETSQRSDHDGLVFRIMRVQRWPAVGQNSWVWYDDPSRPWAYEHYRISSPIRSIVRLPDRADDD